MKSTKLFASILRPSSFVLRPLSSVLRPPSSVLRPSSFVSFFLLILLTFALTPYAAAQGGSPPDEVDVAAEAEKVREALQQSMRAYRLGDTETAYALSRGAYLDYFEIIEIQLRPVDPDLTLEMEYRFADLRSKMQLHALPNEVETSVGAVRDGLYEVEKLFSPVGALVPTLVFGAAFTIIFREGLEALLIISALLGYLQTGAGRKGRTYILRGIGLALAATALTWALLRFGLPFIPIDREVVQAVLSFIAVILLFGVSFWLMGRLNREHWMEFLPARDWAVMASGNALGLTGLTFAAIYREGFESALFYEVLLSVSRRVEVFVLYGFLAGLVVVGVMAWLILRAGRQLPLRVFLGLAVGLVMLLSVAFIGNAVQSLQLSGWLTATSLIGTVPRLPRLLANLTGIHPTIETLSGQAILLVAYLLGGLALWWKSRQTVPRATPEKSLRS